MLRELAQFRENFRQVRKKRFFQIAFLFAFFFLGLSIALPILTLFPEMRTKTFVPLHYNIHFGVDLIGAWWRIFTAPAIGLLVLVVNSVAAIMIWRKERVISYFFGGVMIVAELFLLIGMVFLVLLNISYG